MEHDVSESQQRSFFSSVCEAALANHNLTFLNISGTDLSSVSPLILSEAIVKTKMVHLFDTNLTSEQVDAILARIVESSDSDLNLTTLQTYLESFSLLSPAVLSQAPPEVLARAVVRLEKFDLGHVSFIDPWNFILLKGIDDL